MVKIENKNTFKVGDTVWYVDPWGNLRNGRIYEIKDGHCGTREGKAGGVCAGAKLSDCWPTKQACMDAENKRSALKKEEYKASIRTVEDLAVFLYGHNINDSECPDLEAREAAEERAAELGISLGR